jgi:AAA15 family ATPase/GTPase
MEKQRQTKIHIKNLFLDPNNYRFIDNENYEYIENKELLNSNIQKRTLKFLENKGLEDLESSFKKNGYLSIDIIQVKEIAPKNFLVVEGNRRVAILKKLWEEYQKDNSINLGKLDNKIFKEIPITYYEKYENDNKEVLHLIAMGLKHISGNKKWGAYNEALLVRNLQVQHKMTDNDIIKSLAISKQEFTKILRTLSLIDKYKKSEFGDQFKSSMYSIFQTFTSSPKIRYWIDLDDDMKIKNTKNSDRLFFWISEIEEKDEETGDIIKSDRIISTSTEARNLSKIIDDDKALEEMEDKRSFADGFSISNRVNEDRVNNLLKHIENKFNEVNKLNSFITKKSEDKLEIINELISSLNLKEEQNLFTFQNQDNEVFMNFKSKALSQINIIKYKKLENLKIEELNRINIFSGINNSGKTTILEAINLLINQNDIYNFLDIQRRRGKFIKLNPLWLNSEFINKIEIRGVFNYIPISTVIDKIKEENESLNKELYISTIDMKSSFGDETLSSSARLFEHKNEKFYKTIKIVSNNSYSSPFSIQNKSDLEKHYARAVNKDILMDILDFIKAHIDKDLKDIRFTKEYIKTFKVNHKDFTIDLSSFGEGLQRVFYIALQFASAENGVILIDELENGLHYTLLESFTKFIQELAIKLNVQVFLTTHSKETIEAFVNNKFKNEDINFYRLSQNKRTGHINTIKYNDILLVEELSENQEVRGW